MNDPTATAEAALAALQAVGRPDRVASTARFFKTYPGGYSEGDKFLSVGVPQTRRLAKDFRDLPLAEVSLLIRSQWHDARLMALIIVVERYRRATHNEDQTVQLAIYNFYIEHIVHINNWDLVDSSSEFIVGPWLDSRPEKMKVLKGLASSKSLWERRIAMLATFDYIKKGRADEALAIAGQLLYDKHDLIQKAVGWMLREIGKRVDREPLIMFLDQYSATMPRTTLRYAIEHFTSEQRAHYLSLARQKLDRPGKI